MGMGSGMLDLIGRRNEDDMGKEKMFCGIVGGKNDEGREDIVQEGGVMEWCWYKRW